MSVAAVVEMAKVEVFVKVQWVTCVVRAVAEILISVATDVLVPVIISGRVWVEVDSLPVLLATEVAPAEVCVTMIGVAQVMTDNRRLASVRAPSSGLLCLL